jgi:hypothetical protein
MESQDHTTRSVLTILTIFPPVVVFLCKEGRVLTIFPTPPSFPMSAMIAVQFWRDD